MTVEQLIQKLQGLPQGLPIVTSDDLGDGYNFEAANAIVVSQEHNEDCTGGTCDCQSLNADPQGDMVAIVPVWVSLS